jgi:hypothetical protein
MAAECVKMSYPGSLHVLLPENLYARANHPGNHDIPLVPGSNPQPWRIQPKFGS